MTQIYLIRHGHVDNPAGIFYGPDIQLSERGKRQIEALAQDFVTANIQPAHIYSSPYERTRETTAILAAHFSSAAVTFDERLREWQVNSWTGKPLKEFYAYTGHDKNPNAPLPSDIEPLAACADRIQTVITESINQHSEQTIFIVSHGEPLSSAILRYQGKDWSSVLTLTLPFASSWEAIFKETNKPLSLGLKFDRSNVE